MSFTERYVTTSGSSSNSGTNDTSDAWDLVTGITNMTSGVRLNIKSGSYSIGTGSLVTYTPSSAGTASAPAYMRGYNTTPGDLTFSRDSSGALVTTNFPVITMAYQTRLEIKDYSIVEAIKLIGQRTNGMFFINAYSSVFNCYFEDGGTTGNAVCVYTQSLCSSICHCDIVRTNTDANGYGIGTSNQTMIAYNRIVGNSTANQGGMYLSASCHSIGNTICNYKVGIQIYSTSSGFLCSAIGNTMYNCTQNCITTENSANLQNNCHFIIDNHATDSGRFINHQYSGTIPTTMIGNRTRDNTSADTNLGDWPVRAAITTDNGSASSDYINADTNLYLKPTAVGRASSLVKNKDVGALQSPSSNNAGFCS